MNIKKVNQTKVNVTEPIIVLSLKRSGSTLLMNILNAHPKIFGQLLLTGPLSKAVYTSSYLGAALKFEDSVAVDVEASRRLNALDTTRKTVHGMMGRYVDYHAGMRWCDKSLENLDFLEIIKEVFPDAKYVCLYRHCLDFVQSYLAMTRLRFPPEICPYVSKHPNNIVRALVEYWIEKTNVILDFERKNPQQCIRVNYEVLTSDLKNVLPELFGFLDMSFNDELIDNLFSGDGRSFAEGDIKFHMSKGIYTDSIGSGQDIPVHVIPQPVLNTMLETLNQVGYKASEQDIFNLRQWPDFDQSLNMDESMKRNVGDVIKQFQRVIETKNDYAGKIGGKCKLIVSGEGGGVWLVDLTKEIKKIHTGGGKADCVINLSSNSLCELASKRMGLVEAYQRGTIGIAGNISLATSVGKLLLE